MRPGWTGSFRASGIEIDELGRSPMAQLTDAMDRGDLARAAGWVERLQKQSTMENWPPELWLYGALLQHMGGDSWRGRARLSKMFDELVGTQQRAIFWLWSAWMAADTGETEEWTRSMFEAEKNWRRDVQSGLLHTRPRIGAGRRLESDGELGTGTRLE